MQAVIRKHPITLGVDVERAGSVLKALRAGGMEDAEVVQLVQKFPAVLSTRSVLAQHSSSVLYMRATASSVSSGMSCNFSFPRVMPSIIGGVQLRLADVMLVQAQGCAGEAGIPDKAAGCASGEHLGCTEPLLQQVCGEHHRPTLQLH